LVIGTDNGIYLAERWPKDKNAKPRRILDATAVTQIDTLEEYQLVLVLANKTLSSYPMEALDVNEGQNPLARRPKKIQGHANFFKVGIGLGRHLVCSVKTSALSTTIKVYEPMENLTRGGRKPALGKMFRGGQDALKPFKEYYIPAESSSIHFLRSTLCVGCARGFEVVSLETTESQSLLDQADTSLDFVARKENVKPIHIERISGEFLLNYSDFSFFVNRNGWRARPDWKISWEGTPNAFALSYPYILAFEPNFIEIRHIETSELIHIMTGKNIRMLHSSTREVSLHRVPGTFLFEHDTNMTLDSVCLRRRRRGRCGSQFGLLETMKQLRRIGSVSQPENLSFFSPISVIFFFPLPFFSLCIFYFLFSFLLTLLHCLTS
jgi:RHO1 GDP-GTP exchange protein 1/2